MGRGVTGVAVLGSTGSIGRQTLDVISSFPERFRVVAISARSSRDVFSSQVHRFEPKLISLDERSGLHFPEARRASPEEIAVHPDVDILVVATTGKAGLAPALAALRAGKPVALANKETLVMAGALLTEAARQSGASLRPIDSEHSAIWQCLWGEDHARIGKLILTASGGAFRDLPPEQLQHVTPGQALAHPTWNMGPKITVDSATLFNKGLEVIEARWLFDLPLDQIEVVQHRESIVHSLVEFTDGSVKAQLGVPDMRLPILLSLTYPDRSTTPQTPALDLAALGALHFGRIDRDRYPLLGIAIEAGRRGGTYPAALAAADETAVHHFLAGRISFVDIAQIVEQVLEKHESVSDPSLDQIIAADEWARKAAEETLTSRV
ncbi:MAG: 1-deoxy-D-xylulose-5-phosphate reductoisomerase [Dehalococcoidia bacterium]|nr:1-deoxy-D-xylulose-5-phosphate reductoisomerase [Dehalococcoidia bacterium]